MTQKIEEKLLKIAKAIIKYKDFYNKDLCKKNFYWKSELKKNSLRDSEVGVLINNFDIEKIIEQIDDNSSEEKIFSLLKKEYQPKNQFIIGDKVDFVNDYGVIFKDHTITNFTLYEFGGYLYDTDKNDTSWCWKKEKNLHLTGTYVEPNLDLELNNGSFAKFSHFDYWDNKVFIIKTEWNSFNAVFIDGVLHSISDHDEPIEPIHNKYQPK
ncbi:MULTISPECIES: hypothetical protein [Arcobacteraceae]|uniref:hypothetical protein n=1 Tax=Arcobacteraceae TaxID=2808963 RepID=UPI000DAFF8B2|nr:MULTISPECIES: hypothetical protein [Arcobacteraceae]MCT7591523.1 hypothetical protein [Aliarcobacter butzleri]MCT7910292.1 hypothetical protein [Arcobacter lacus]MDN5061823.1 hypothetical protein [Aliarcobacter butzleri]PZQ08882.1 MAG: hypothetical protein DI567_01490 [Aliarcobacter butzleri]